MLQILSRARATIGHLHESDLQLQERRRCLSHVFVPGVVGIDDADGAVVPGADIVTPGVVGIAVRVVGIVASGVDGRAAPVVFLERC